MGGGEWWLTRTEQVISFSSLKFSLSSSFLGSRHCKSHETGLARSVGDELRVEDEQRGAIGIGRDRSKALTLFVCVCVCVLCVV